jgi:hypothetical protein
MASLFFGVDVPPGSLLLSHVPSTPYGGSTGGAAEATRRRNRFGGASSRLLPDRWSIDPVNASTGTGHQSRMSPAEPGIPARGPVAVQRGPPESSQVPARSSRGRPGTAGIRPIARISDPGETGRPDRRLSLRVQAMDGELGPWPQPAPGGESLTLLAVIMAGGTTWGSAVGTSGRGLAGADWRVRQGRTGRVYSRRMLFPRREMSAP